MKHPTMSTCGTLNKLLLIACSLIVLPVAAFGQTSEVNKPKQLTLEQFAGRYKGTAQSPTRDLALALEIKFQDGKLSGSLSESKITQQILSGEIADGKLVVHLQDSSGTARLTLEPRDGRLSGRWIIASGEWGFAGGEPGVVRFERVTETSAPDISGEWDGAADAQGQAFPFTLTLKVEGDKVTGSSSSELGTTTISSGVWKDGKLAIVLESGSGQIGLVATVQDGKLVGDYDFAGQMQGKWVAVRKNK